MLGFINARRHEIPLVAAAPKPFTFSEEAAEGTFAKKLLYFCTQRLRPLPA